MNDNKIAKIVAFCDNRNTEEKTVTFAKAYVTTEDGKTKVLTNNQEITRTLRKLQEQQNGKSLKELEKSKMLEAVQSYEYKKGAWVLSRTAQDKDEALNDASKIVASKLQRENPYDGKETKDIPNKNSKLKKALVAGGIIAGVVLLANSCSLQDKLNSLFNKDAKVVSEDPNKLAQELTDREILEKDFDYYADNYEYGVQMEVAYTANAFLEQANNNIKSIGLKTEDGKEITGLFTEEEAWVYAITIHNLGVDDIAQVYQDSSFDYAKFEDTKQMLITKMMQYQMLVGFGKVEQLDFTSEFMMPHDDFAKEVFAKIADDIADIGKNISDKTEAKAKIKVLHDDLENYANSGNLTQNLQDMLQVMYSPAYFSGVLVESAYGSNTYFTEKFGEELVGKGLCTDVDSEENTQEIRSQHDNAWADSADNLQLVQNLNKEEYELALQNKNGYIYYMNEALQSLGNDAVREDKYKYSEITVDNVKEVHEKAEKLVKDYLTVEKNLVEGTNAFNKEFNNIVTDKQDGNLSVETILSLISDNSLIKGYSAGIDGYSFEELQYQLSVAINNEISESMKEISTQISKSGTTKLPSKVEKQITMTREQAVQKFGESTVKKAETEAFDNNASKDKAEQKAEQVKQEAQDNLDKGNYEDLKENAGKNDPENKDKYEENVNQAIKDKEETDKIESQGPSGEVNIDKELEDLIEKGDGFVEVEQGKTPEGDVYEGDPGKIEWSDGESLGENADKVTTQNVKDPTTSNETQPETDKDTTNNGNVSGGDISYDVPEDWFEPAATYSMNRSVEAESTEVETYTGSVTGGDIVYDIPEDMIEFYTTDDGYASSDITAMMNMIEDVEYEQSVEEGYSYQKTR